MRPQAVYPSCSTHELKTTKYSCPKIAVNFGNLSHDGLTCLGLVNWGGTLDP